MVKSSVETFALLFCFALNAITIDAYDCSKCNPDGTVETCNNTTNPSCSCARGYRGIDCYECNKGFYRTSNTTCAPCICNAFGSVENKTCSADTGVCPCKRHVIGKLCSKCEEGFEADIATNGALLNCYCKKGEKYNETEEKCQKDENVCLCFNHSDKCDELTNACLNCTANTTGKSCDKCKFKFYGDARTGQLDACKPCPPCSFRFATGSCHLENRKPVCDCNIGHYGEKCEKCAKGWYRASSDSQCKKCKCNGNLDLTVTNSCDPVTGKCLHCMFNTTGEFCEKCAAGYHGDAVKGICMKRIKNTSNKKSAEDNSHYIILGICVPLGVGLLVFVTLLLYHLFKNKQRRRLPFWTVELSSRQYDNMDFSLLDPVTDSPYRPVLSDIEDQVNDALDKIGYIDEGQL